LIQVLFYSIKIALKDAIEFDWGKGAEMELCQREIARPSSNKFVVLMLM
jgi:hypothetical protein